MSSTQTITRPMSDHFSKIPAELKKLKQWGVYRDKIPYQTRNPRRMMSKNKPEEWASYEESIKVVRRGDADGISFVITESDSYFMVDLDGCVKEGHVHPEALSIVDFFDSYTELSRSGEGLHIIGKGDIGPGFKLNASKGDHIPWAKGQDHVGIEIADRGQLVYLTGKLLGDNETLRHN